jgi:hypothetical protein
MYIDVPEPRLEPPEEEYIIADCGHEIYEGESEYRDMRGRSYCEQCIRDRADSLDTYTLAVALGYKVV